MTDQQPDAAQQQVAALTQETIDLVSAKERAETRCGLLEKALEAYQCAECGGRGIVNTPCPDPQCGDSTWDHECGLGSRPCSKCKGQSANSLARAVLKKAPDAGEPVTVQVAKPLGHILQLRLTGEDMRRLEQLAALAPREPNIIRFAEILLSEALAPPEAPDAQG